jgi:hypothetical protein
MNYLPTDMRYMVGTYKGNPGSTRKRLDDERHPIVRQRLAWPFTE